MTDRTVRGHAALESGGTWEDVADAVWLVLLRHRAGATSPGTGAGPSADVPPTAGGEHSPPAIATSVAKPTGAPLPTVMPKPPDRVAPVYPKPVTSAAPGGTEDSRPGADVPIRIPVARALTDPLGLAR